MIAVRRQEVYRYLGYRSAVLPDDDVREKVERCIAALQDAARPASVYRRFPVHHTDAGLEIASCRTESKALARAMRDCSEAFFFAATLGIGPDRLIQRAKLRSISDAVVYQAAGAEMIEAYCDSVQEELEGMLRQEGKRLRPRFSPGYGDLPLSFQRGLLSVLSASKEIGISLTDSLLMVPSKSVTAIIGITGQEAALPEERGCSQCGKTDCIYRKETQ